MSRLPILISGLCKVLVLNALLFKKRLETTFFGLILRPIQLSPYTSSRMKTHFLLSLLLVTLSQVAFAQCDCTELLKYGLYNHFAATSRVSNYAVLSSAVSNAYTESTNKQTGAGGSYGVMNASFNQSQGRSIGKLVTDNNFSATDANELLTTSSAFISPDMIDAYKACLASCNKSGLAFKANIPSDNLARAIKFTMVYTPLGFTKRSPKVRKIALSSPDCYTCKGSLADLAADSTQRAKPFETYTLLCERKITKEPFKIIGSDNEPV